MKKGMKVFATLGVVLLLAGCSLLKVSVSTGDPLSKEQMMEITHKTGGNIDTCKSRLRQKILRYVKSLY